MRVFLDSSALVKRHIGEPGTREVLAWLGRADDVVISILAFPEVVSAFARLRREGQMTAEEYRVRKQRLASDSEKATVMELSPDIVERAVVCLEQTPLRASDAIHIASAIEAGVDCFVSADRRQCEAAKAMGLAVEDVSEGG